MYFSRICIHVYVCICVYIHMIQMYIYTYVDKYLPGAALKHLNTLCVCHSVEALERRASLGGIGLPHLLQL